MKKENFILRAIRTKVFLIGLVFFACLTSARAQDITPFLDCVEPVLENGVPTGELRAYFGYHNPDYTFVFNYGGNNYFSPNPGGIYNGQSTTTFLPGIHKRSFSIVFGGANRPSEVHWILTGKAARTSTVWSAFCGNGETQMTFQGRLTVSGAAASQPHDFQFQFYDRETGGTARGAVFEMSNVPVTNGIFTVRLDAEYIFKVYRGNGGFLEIRVRRSGSPGAYTTLAPRQQLATVPFAYHAKNVSGGVIHLEVLRGSPNSQDCSIPEDHGRVLLSTNANGINELFVCGMSGWKKVTLQ